MLSAKQIAPGKTGEIRVEVATDGVTELSKSVAVTTNDSEHPQVFLNVKAVVEPEFDLSRRFLSFGNVESGKEVTENLFVAVPAGKQAEVLGARATESAFGVKVEAVPGSGGKKYKVSVTLKADASEGFHIGTIVLKTSSKLKPEVKIPVRSNIVPGRPTPPGRNGAGLFSAR